MRLALVLAALAPACQSPRRPFTLPGLPPDLESKVDLHGGYRMVDHPFVESQPFLMVEFEGYRPRDPVGFEVGFSFATDEADAFGGVRGSDFYEGFLGLRRTFGRPDGPLHPYVSVGASWIQEEIEHDPAIPGADPRATGAGGYARAGAWWAWPTRLDGDGELALGFDLRGVLADDLDFLQASLFLGVGH